LPFFPGGAPGRYDANDLDSAAAVDLFPDGVGHREDKQALDET